MKMDWKQIVVVLAVAIFVFEMFAFGLLGGPAGPLNSAPNATSRAFTGNTQAPVTMESYEPYIILNEKNLSEAQLESIRAMESVEDVRMVQDQPVVTAVRREDLETLFYELAAGNTSPQMVALISLPPFLEVETPDGIRQFGIPPGATLRQVIGFYLPIGGSVNGSLEVTGQGEQLTAITGFEFVRERMQLQMNGTIGQETGKTTQYEVPWERRDGINVTALRNELNESGIGYARRNYVDVERNLTQQNALDIQKLPYVVQISGNRVSVLGNFTDKEQIAQDIRLPVVFPNSTLTIPGQRTIDVEGMSLNPTYQYSYSIQLDISEAYRWNGKDVELTTDTPQTKGETVPLDIEAELIGNAIVAIKEVSVAR